MLLKRVICCTVLGNNSELVSGRNPFPDCAASLFKVADREIGQLGYASSMGKLPRVVVVFRITPFRF